MQTTIFCPLPQPLGSSPSLSHCSHSGQIPWLLCPFPNTPDSARVSWLLALLQSLSALPSFSAPLSQCQVPSPPTRLVELSPAASRAVPTSLVQRAGRGENTHTLSLASSGPVFPFDPPSPPPAASTRVPCCLGVTGSPSTPRVPHLTCSSVPRDHPPSFYSLRVLLPSQHRASASTLVPCPWTLNPRQPISFSDTFWGFSDLCGSLTQGEFKLLENGARTPPRWFVP